MVLPTARYTESEVIEAINYLLYVCVCMYVKHVNHSTTLQNNSTAYENHTTASLPCVVSGPGMGCYFQFHHIGTRRSNPNLRWCSAMPNHFTSIDGYGLCYQHVYVCKERYVYIFMYVCVYYVSKYVFRIALRDIHKYVCADIALCM